MLNINCHLEVAFLGSNMPIVDQNLQDILRISYSEDVLRSILNEHRIVHIMINDDLVALSFDRIDVDFDNNTITFIDDDINENKSYKLLTKHILSERFSLTAVLFVGDLENPTLRLIRIYDVVANSEQQRNIELGQSTII